MPLTISPVPPFSLQKGRFSRSDVCQKVRLFLNQSCFWCCYHIAASTSASAATFATESNLSKANAIQ
jgi:hypothetical protein